MAGKIDQDLSRVFSSRAGVSASYSYSRRLSFNLGVNGNRNQFLGGRRRGDEGDEILFIEDATVASASGGLSYELTQRTRLGANLSVSRNFSPIREAYTTNQTVTLQQQLGRRWSAGVSAGAGSTHDIGGTGSEPPLDRRTWTAAANLSYSGREHSVGASASRNVGDSLGLGALTSVTYSAFWNWSRPGSRWAVTGRASRSNSDFGGFGSRKASLVGVALTRQLSRQFSSLTQYTYVFDSSPFTGILSNFGRHRALFALIWTPQPRGVGVAIPLGGPYGF